MSHSVRVWTHLPHNFQKVDYENMTMKRSLENHKVAKVKWNVHVFANLGWPEGEVNHPTIVRSGSKSGHT